MNTPTIVIKYQCQESLEWMPDIFIDSMEKAIKAQAGNYIKLHEIRLELKNLLAETENQILDIDDPNWRKEAMKRQLEAL